MSKSKKSLDWKWWAAFVVAIFSCCGTFLALIPLLRGCQSMLPVPVIVPSSTISPADSQTSRASGEMIDHLEATMEQQVVSLVEGELLVGTAEQFFILDESESSLLCTAFLVKGPIELEIVVIEGGWDHWIEVYDEDFAEDLLTHKQAELEEADCPWGRRTVRLP